MAQKKSEEKNTVEKKDRWVLKNLIGAVAFVVILLILTSVGLRLVTRHGKTVTAPDFTSLSMQEAENLAAQHLPYHQVRSASQSGDAQSVRLLHHRGSYRA